MVMRPLTAACLLFLTTGISRAQTSGRAETPVATPPTLIGRARALLASAAAGADRAAAWAERNLTRERAEALFGELKADTRARLDRALEQAQQRHAGEMGLRVFNGKTLSLGAQAWSRLDAPGVGAMPSRVVVLIHGLDEPGDIWNDLVPELALSGHTAVRFDYDNDGPIAGAADRLGESLRSLRALGVRETDLVCHSMGGLVARDTLARAAYYGGTGAGHAELPDVTRLILIATPNLGSAWAPLEFLAEARDQFQRWLDSDASDTGHLVGWMVDGRGQAASDLAPGSAFLRTLNARPLPVGVRITTIVGRASPLSASDVDELLNSRFARSLLSDREIDELKSAAARAIDMLGDGPVSTDSARLPGVTDEVCVDAAHNAMLRRITISNMARAVINPGTGADEPPKAVPVILDRLSR